MRSDIHIPLFEMVMCFSGALDLVSREVVDHHKKVAFIAYSLASELGLPKEERTNMLLAGALHDSGAFSRTERLAGLNFELVNPHKHAERGYLLLKEFEPFSKIAELVRFHHVPWNNGRGVEFKNQMVSFGSHILHLADRVSVLMKNDTSILGQVSGICSSIEKQSGKMFEPKLVKAFKSLAAKEYFWFDVISAEVTDILAKKAGNTAVELNLEELLKLSNLFRHIIDFRNPFTANHSLGVAATAEKLGSLMGFSTRESQMLRVAGYLHDLGKLAVPVEVLDKPGKLTEEEGYIIKSHTYYTYRILESITGLDDINAWASFHHERLDGKGYPFHYQDEDLPLGSRIMAVADVFTAISEDRPYRKGMESDKALAILNQMTEESALDANVVLTLRRNYEELNYVRAEAQKKSEAEYYEFGRQSEYVLDA